MAACSRSPPATLEFSASHFVIDPVSGLLRQIPNVISAIRILLVLPIAAALVSHRLPAAIALFAAAAVSDAADGFLAKRYGWQTELGAVLDPAADKLLLAAVFVTLAYLRLIPLWLMAAAVARDVIIVTGALLYRLCLGPLAMRPSVISKLNTLCQVAFIMAVIGREEFSLPPDWVVLVLGALVFVTTVISGIDYVLIYGLRAWSHTRLRPAGRAAAQAGGRRS
jgi:cardiolipin synthase (CMP-forming)